ncbi:hypothetical protein CTM97_18065 [Photobacterium phosphoreum]|uniref:Replication initiation protein-like C-terminal domain-containing protein n=1 Tax=Photobacterium phosphoreum TaxID=659 RepID=A0A2T3JU37_PHOPO|nr:replication initiation factor domain-containing protein [Photobacterium phosphoreum]PSU20266.1 hypothetical protein CTM96_19820 [Photobacterium phosphoreum]PSU38976.1 hypothetical protein CTM97_18065 [Photobacterium phosphoreum]PSU52688.1 hypothetical protein C9J18_09080 [Photobacterium phosphoreum]
MTALTVNDSAKSPRQDGSVFVDWLRVSAPLYSLSELNRARNNGIDFDDSMKFTKLPVPDYNMYKGDARLHRIELHKQRVNETLVTNLREFCWLVLGFNCSIFTCGMNGYTNGFKLFTPDNLTAGHVSFGGNRDTFCIDINGGGSSYLFDNVRRKFHDARDLTPEILHFWLSGVLKVTTLKRLDLAIDFRDGLVVVDDARKAYKIGAFRRSTGKYPQYKDVISGDVDGTILGDTFYVGTRKSLNMWRVYNKALQLGVDGEWVRAEVELKDIHVDILLDIESYYSGMCEFASSICATKPKKLPLFDKAKKAACHILSKTNHFRNQYSKSLHALLTYFQGDLSAVFGLLMRQEDIDDLVFHEVLDRFSVSPTTLKLNEFVNCY